MKGKDSNIINITFSITIRGNFKLKHTYDYDFRKIYKNNVPITLIEIDDVC